MGNAKHPSFITVLEHFKTNLKSLNTIRIDRILLVKDWIKARA